MLGASPSKTGALFFSIVFYAIHLMCSDAGNLGRVYDELGGRSFHLRRKTKLHKHHHINILNSSLFTKEIGGRDDIKSGNGDHGYSLRSTSYAYVLELDLGTPGQKLEFLIDTGSANMAIAGPECRDEHGAKCKIDNFYYPDRSSTAKRIGHPVETEYGKGSWSGDVYRDVVGFPNGPKLLAEFAVIKNEKEFFIKNSVNEGILGLAYKSLSSSSIEPLYDQLVHERKSPDVFSLSLCNGNGRFWLDYPAKNEYHHPLFWTRIIHRAWYTVRMTGIDVAGQSLGLSPYSYPPAIVDSGTTDILLEPEIYIAVIAMLKKNGPNVDERFWNNYCVLTDPYKWPYITIYLKDMRGGSFALTILGKHYVRKQDQFYCLSIGAKQFGAVLGEVTLEGNVVVFDRANHRVGFAPSNLTDPETGSPCGNPVTINTTVSGTLQDFCRAPFMPPVSCHYSCDRCVSNDGAWCPRGRIYLWINGVKSALDGSAGFCWLGNIYSFEMTRFQTYLEGHGSVEFEIECFSILPMYKQCVLRGEWLFAIAIVASFAASILCMCVCCRRVYEADARDNYPVYKSTSQRELFPIHDQNRDRTFRRKMSDKKNPKKTKKKKKSSIEKKPKKNSTTEAITEDVKEKERPKENDNSPKENGVPAEQPTDPMLPMIYADLEEKNEVEESEEEMSFEEEDILESRDESESSSESEEEMDPEELEFLEFRRQQSKEERDENDIESLENLTTDPEEEDDKTPDEEAPHVESWEYEVETTDEELQRQKVRRKLPKDTDDSDETEYETVKSGDEDHLQDDVDEVQTVEEKKSEPRPQILLTETAIIEEYDGNFNENFYLVNKSTAPSSVYGSESDDSCGYEMYELPKKNTRDKGQEKKPKMKRKVTRLSNTGANKNAKLDTRKRKKEKAKQNLLQDTEEASVIKQLLRPKIRRTYTVDLKVYSNIVYPNFSDFEPLSNGEHELNRRTEKQHYSTVNAREAVGKQKIPSAKERHYHSRKKRTQTYGRLHKWYGERENESDCSPDEDIPSYKAKSSYVKSRDKVIAIVIDSMIEQSVRAAEQIDKVKIHKQGVYISQSILHELIYKTVEDINQRQLNDAVDFALKLLLDYWEGIVYKNIWNIINDRLDEISEEIVTNVINITISELVHEDHISTRLVRDTLADALDELDVPRNRILNRMFSMFHDYNFPDHKFCRVVKVRGKLFKSIKERDDDLKKRRERFNASRDERKTKKAKKKKRKEAERLVENILEELLENIKSEHDDSEKNETDDDVESSEGDENELNDEELKEMGLIEDEQNENEVKEVVVNKEDNEGQESNNEESNEEESDNEDQNEEDESNEEESNNEKLNSEDNEEIDNEDANKESEKEIESSEENDTLDLSSLCSEHVSDLWFSNKIDSDVELVNKADYLENIRRLAIRTQVLHVWRNEGIKLKESVRKRNALFYKLADAVGNDHENVDINELYTGNDDESEKEEENEDELLGDPEDQIAYELPPIKEQVKRALETNVIPHKFELTQQKDKIDKLHKEERNDSALGSELPTSAEKRKECRPESGFSSLHEENKNLSEEETSLEDIIKLIPDMDRDQYLNQWIMYGVTKSPTPPGKSAERNKTVRTFRHQRPVSAQSDVTIVDLVPLDPVLYQQVRKKERVNSARSTLSTCYSGRISSMRIDSAMSQRLSEESEESDYDSNMRYKKKPKNNTKIEFFRFDNTEKREEKEEDTTAAWDFYLQQRKASRQNKRRGKEEERNKLPECIKLLTEEKDEILKNFTKITIDSMDEEELLTVVKPNVQGDVANDEESDQEIERLTTPWQPNSGRPLTPDSHDSEEEVRKMQDELRDKLRGTKSKKETQRAWKKNMEKKKLPQTAWKKPPNKDHRTADIQTNRELFIKLQLSLKENKKRVKRSSSIHDSIGVSKTNAEKRQVMNPKDDGEIAQRRVQSTPTSAKPRSEQREKPSQKIDKLPTIHNNKKGVVTSHQGNDGPNNKKPPPKGTKQQSKVWR